MEAIIVNYRRGVRTQKPNQMVLFIPGYDKKKSQSLVGKKVVYTCEGKDKKQITGEIRAVHGNNGNVRVLFERGMPGQSIGSKVEVQ